MVDYLECEHGLPIALCRRCTPRVAVFKEPLRPGHASRNLERRPPPKYIPNPGGRVRLKRASDTRVRLKRSDK